MSPLEKLPLPEQPPMKKLGVYDRSKNPTFESHDPGLMKDPVTGWYLSYSTDSSCSKTKPKQGIPLRRSRDLVHWEYLDTVLEEDSIQQAKQNGNRKPTPTFWAPFVEYSHGEYRMYYSSTRGFGSSESKIWLAVSQKPEGPFVNRGVAMDTWDTDNTLPNAIDAHIVDTPEGEKYMIYGSFFGGIFAKQLDPKTGMPLDGNSRSLGTLLARKGHNTVDGPEGAAVIYNPEERYYYLFLSYGWLGDGYDIRVARSRSVTGPYVDYQGRSMIGDTMGVKLAGSYQFTASDPLADTSTPNWTYGGFRGPGHGVPFFDPDTGRYYFCHHVRDGAKAYAKRHTWEGKTSFTKHFMMIRQMVFVHGWPVFSPEDFAGEDQGLIPADCLPGTWEFIHFPEKGDRPKKGKAGSLKADGTGIWMDKKPMTYEYQQEQGLLTLQGKKQTVTGKVLKCYDLENSHPTICFTGLTQDGEAVWGKLLRE